MMMMAATATTLIASRIQKPLERKPSVISRRATRATGRSRTLTVVHLPGLAWRVVGVGTRVLVGGATDELEEDLGERSPLEPEAVDGAGAACRVEGRLRPLDDAAVAGRRRSGERRRWRCRAP